LFSLWVPLPIHPSFPHLSMWSSLGRCKLVLSSAPEPWAWAGWPLMDTFCWPHHQYPSRFCPVKGRKDIHRWGPWVGLRMEW
jgi:hypothetical protein